MQAGRGSPGCAHTPAMGAGSSSAEGPNHRKLTLEERGLDVADVLERVFEEDQHRGIHDLILVFSVCVAIEVTDVSAQVFHSMQNITETSEEERQ